MTLRKSKVINCVHTLSFNLINNQLFPLVIETGGKVKMYSCVDLYVRNLYIISRQGLEWIYVKSLYFIRIRFYY